MEIFLLLLDEIDDVFGILRSRARSIMGFMTALLLFCATGFLLLQLPLLAFALFAVSIWLLTVAVRSRVAPLAIQAKR